MKCHTRRAAGLVLAVVLSLPTIAVAAPSGRDRGQDRDPIVRVIKKIQKIFGIGTHDDLPGPPIPASPKP